MKILPKAFKREVVFLAINWVKLTKLRGPTFFQLHLKSATFWKVACMVIPLVHNHILIYLAENSEKGYVFLKFLLNISIYGYEQVV